MRTSGYTEKKMRIYRSFEEIERNENTVVTLGTFDGVHKGHQLILDRLMKIAAKDDLRAVAMTIYPHPQIVLKKDGLPPVKLLTSIEERIIIFEKLGIKHLLIIPFSKEFAKTPPDIFIRDYIHGQVGMKKILIGYDHMFGKNRKGTPLLLDELSRELQFSVEKMPALQNKDIIISSTKIRNHISDSNVSIANEMLGYDYYVYGRVVRGDGRGRTLGIPTANIRPYEENKLMPGNGVYLVSSIIHGKRYYGMANIGFRPTFTDDIQSVLEINFFDFDQDIYDEDLTIEFHSFIRHEEKFSGKDEFLNQLKKDRQECHNRIKEKEN